MDDLSEKLVQAAPLLDIVTSYVVHCPQAFGISFTHENGCKVTYSGDTMPSKDLINIGNTRIFFVSSCSFTSTTVHRVKRSNDESF